jgi:signal transduction histidine kinase
MRYEESMQAEIFPAGSDKQPIAQMPGTCNGFQAEDPVKDKRNLQRLMRINEITRAALEEEALSQVVRLLAERLGLALGSNGCCITLWDEEEQDAHPASTWIGEFSKGPVRPFQEEDYGLTRMLFESGRSVTVQDFRSNPAVPREASPGGKIRFAIGIPLRVGSQKIGGLIFLYQKLPGGAERDFGYWGEIGSLTALVLAKAVALEKERQQRLEAEALQEAAASAAGGSNLQSVWDRMLGSSQKVIPFDSAAIVLNEQGVYRIAAASGFPDPGEDTSLTQAGLDFLFEELEISLRPVIVQDIRQDERCGQASRELPGHLISWIGAPVPVMGKLAGFLTFASRRPGVFRQRHIALAQTLAAHASAAITRHRLFEEVRAGRERSQFLAKRLVEVQEAERRYLAHELHDEIGQILTGLQFTLETGKNSTGEEMIESLANGQAIVGELMERIREIAINLRPSMLDTLGLLPALESFFRRYQTQTGISIVFHHSGLERRFDGEIETTAYRLVQETLTNAARYAETSEVRVQITADDSKLQLAVCDTGKGFEVDQVMHSKKTFGLAGLRERTNWVGGVFEIASQPGSGTTINATFPINARLERRRYDRQGLIGG